MHRPTISYSCCELPAHSHVHSRQPRHLSGVHVKHVALQVSAMKVFHIACMRAVLATQAAWTEGSRGRAPVEPLPASGDDGVGQHEAVEDLEDQVQGCNTQPEHMSVR